MKQYLWLLQDVLDNGIDSEDRTGTGTKSVFSRSLKFNLADGFPIVTTKFVNYKAVLNELLWFITGSSDINELDSKIWDEWATETGNIGPMYGSQWRHWLDAGCMRDIDQLSIVIENIKHNPNSRRHIVSAWNVAYLPDESISAQQNVCNGQMALAPCHKDFQFYVRNGILDLHWNQRSVDVFLGLPFNIASYATLLCMVAQITKLKPGMLSFHGVDVHLYNNHVDQAKIQLNRSTLELPTLALNKMKMDIDDFNINDVALVGYNHQGKLIGKISV